VADCRLHCCGEIGGDLMLPRDARLSEVGIPAKAGAASRRFRARRLISALSIATVAVGCVSGSAAPVAPCARRAIGKPYHGLGGTFTGCVLADLHLPRHSTQLRSCTTTAPEDGDAQRADGFSGLAQPGSQAHRVAWLTEALAAKRVATPANVIALRDAGRSPAPFSSSAQCRAPTTQGFHPRVHAAG
jgi:hypothetical protein